MKHRVLTPFVLLLVAACSTSPLGRKQLKLVPDDQMNAMGTQAFDEMRKTTPVVKDDQVTQYVKCVVDPILEAAKGQTGNEKWEIEVFQDESANAFALPGGKIGVNTGLFPVAKTPDQLATVIGHEVGHVIAEHGAERVSEQLVTAGGLSAVDLFLSGSASAGQRQLILGALDLGSQVGYALPHSRTQESEADIIGLQLMAKAGFDPRQSIALWQNMSAAAGGSAPPEFLSTHPASKSRIENLQSHMGEALKASEQSNREGKDPSCNPPTKLSSPGQTSGATRSS